MKEIHPEATPNTSELKRGESDIPTTTIAHRICIEIPETG